MPTIRPCEGIQSGREAEVIVMQQVKEIYGRRMDGIRLPDMVSQPCPSLQTGDLETVDFYLCLSPCA